jgi:diketogulonate reductase-like aldo/keto reductase
MINRRQILKISATLAATQITGLRAETTDPASTAATTLIRKAIPGSGELLPVVGMGTSQTFDTGDDAESIKSLTEVMQAFYAGGGSIIDSSPMYGNAESRVGDVLRAMAEKPETFAATKVWTQGKNEGIAQMQESAQRMNVERFDLIAVHNLKDWKTHLATLKDWKESGKVRYIGITTSHGRDHNDLLDIMRQESLDFVQFSYNIEDRAAEAELLPLAQERSIATMINRPYQRGSLFGKSRGKPVPDVAQDLVCDSWGQFYLKWILGHPAATCVIPATSKARHMHDNMKANYGRLPDATERQEMLRAFQAL